MSRNKREQDYRTADTMQLEDAIEGFEPVSDDQPEEYFPYDTAEPEQYAKAERALTVITYILSGLLVVGSFVFWWYFVSNLSVCPIAVNDYELYQAMLVGCAVIPLLFTVVQAVRRSRVTPEGWMMNMCISGVITAIIMIIYNITALSHSFEWHNALTILCFSVSGCALPAAVYTVVRYLIECFCGWVRWSASIDRETVLADVRSQCEGEF